MQNLGLSPTNSTVSGAFQINDSGAAVGFATKYVGGTLVLNGTWTNAGLLTETNSTVNLGGTFGTADLGNFSGSGGTINGISGRAGQHN